MIDTSNMVIELDALFAENLDASLLTECIESAIRFYSRFNPNIVRTTVSLVDGTDMYSLPDDFLLLDWFDWEPEGETTVSTPDTSEVWEPVYNRIAWEATAARKTPFVRVVGGKLVLDPVPDTDEDVDMSYFALHMANVDGDYDTVPTVDDDIVLKLALAELVLRRVPQITLSPNVTEGLLQLEFDSLPMNSARVASILRRSVKDKYGGY